MKPRELSFRLNIQHWNGFMTGSIYAASQLTQIQNLVLSNPGQHWLYNTWRAKSRSANSSRALKLPNIPNVKKSRYFCPKIRYWKRSWSPSQHWENDPLWLYSLESVAKKTFLNVPGCLADNIKAGYFQRLERINYLFVAINRQETWPLKPFAFIPKTPR